MAQLVPAPISRPGIFGLNTQNASVVQPIGWATVAKNAKYNETGALASRKGYRHLNASSLVADVVQTHTYVDGAGNSLLIWSTATKLYKLVGSTATDITGTATTPTAGNWKFQDFNGKCVAWQTGHTPIVIDDVADTFADLTGTAIPSGNEVLSAFGRLWVVDGDTLKWSDLLIYNDFSGGTAGSADLATYWPEQDEAIGLADHNGFLFVWGKDNLIILESPKDPSNLAIVEAIPNAGLVGRDAKVNTPEDFAYVTKRGITTLDRTIQEKSLPISQAVEQVADDLSRAVQAASSADDIKMAFSQEENSAYLTTGAEMFVFDLKLDSPRVLTWDLVPNCLHEHDRVMYYGLTNYIAYRDGYKDAVASDGTGGNSYDFDFESAWHEMDEFEIESRLKILKKAVTRVSGSANQTFAYKWYTDFSDNVNSRNLTIPNTTVSEHGVSKYSVDEFSGAPPIYTLKSGMSRSGRVIKFGVKATVDGDEFSVRSITIKMKLGRSAD